MTPLGTGLDRKVIQPLVVSRARANQLQKPVLAIIVTDGGERRGEEENFAICQSIEERATSCVPIKLQPQALCNTSCELPVSGTDAAMPRSWCHPVYAPAVQSQIVCVQHSEQLWCAEPTGEPRDAVHAVIVGAKRYFESMQYGPGAVAFQFAQVGVCRTATLQWHTFASMYRH